MTWRNKQNTQSSLIDYIFIPEDTKTSVLKTKIHESVPFTISDQFPVTVSFLSDRFISGDKMWTYVPFK
jgi:exonuclease III